MSKVEITLRSGANVTVLSSATDGGFIYLCGKESCPHYKGQRGLIPGAEDMYCGLVGYNPDRTCQAYYREDAEFLDQTRRSIWDRLEEAEAFEAAVQRAAAEAAA